MLAEPSTNLTKALDKFLAIGDLKKKKITKIVTTSRLMFLKI